MQKGPEPSKTLAKVIFSYLHTLEEIVELLTRPSADDTGPINPRSEYELHSYNALKQNKKFEADVVCLFLFTFIITILQRV